jgi:hypothetical protein
MINVSEEPAPAIFRAKNVVIRFLWNGNKFLLEPHGKKTIFFKSAVVIQILL